MFKRLLAKSDKNGNAEATTLSVHTAYVLASADRLLAARGESAIAAARLSKQEGELLFRIVRVGAFTHDFGKCSDHFQTMIQVDRKRRQGIRHEALSLLACWTVEPLREWLLASGLTKQELLLALTAAAGHHRKFLRYAIADSEQGAGTELTLLMSHPDFQSTLRVGKNVLQLPDQPVLSDQTVALTRRGSPKTQFERIGKALEDLGGRERIILSLAKAFVIAADVVGSALGQTGDPISWITEVLAQRATYDQLERVVKHGLKGNQIRGFQEAVANSDAPITLIRAGCGSGKTLAAYAWFRDHHIGRQLWFTYPTTGTATEGFLDYLRGDDLEIDAALEHSRAEVDIQIFDLADGDPERGDQRLSAIRLWGKSSISATVDTVLGIIQNQRRGVYSWPGISHSAIVFDEIHSYDEGLFGSLVRFLTALPGIPVLLMTASLPASRLEALQRLSREVHGTALEIVDGPADLETLPRYQQSEEEPWSAVRRTLEQGGKVLWVSNTVQRCRETFEEARRQLLPVLIYHSRYKYCHRVRRHREVIGAFGGSASVLACTTQVAEMSLDLSADLLITDLAPVPGIIQRLGRLNRRSSPGKPNGIKPFIIIPFGEEHPYTASALANAIEWLSSLGGDALSQRDLIARWKHEADVQIEHPSAWLDEAFSTVQSDLREPTPGLTVVHEIDVSEIRRGVRKAVEVALPMSWAPKGWESWPRINGYRIAPSEALEYDAERGGRWRD